MQAALGRCGRREQGLSTGCNNFSDQRMRAGCSDAGGGPARRQAAAPCSSNLDRRRQQRARPDRPRPLHALVCPRYLDTWARRVMERSCGSSPAMPMVAGVCSTAVGGRRRRCGRCSARPCGGQPGAPPMPRHGPPPPAAGGRGSGAGAQRQSATEGAGRGGGAGGGARAGSEHRGAWRQRMNGGKAGAAHRLPNAAGSSAWPAASAAQARHRASAPIARLSCAVHRRSNAPRPPLATRALPSRKPPPPGQRQAAAPRCRARWSCCGERPRPRTRGPRCAAAARRRRLRNTRCAAAGKGLSSKLLPAQNSVVC